MKDYMREYIAGRLKHIPRIIGDERSPIKRCQKILDDMPDQLPVCYTSILGERVLGWYCRPWPCIVLHPRFENRESIDKYLVIFHEVTHHIRYTNGITASCAENVFSCFGKMSWEEVICDMTALLILAVAGCMSYTSKEIDCTTAMIATLTCSTTRFNSLIRQAQGTADRILGLL